MKLFDLDSPLMQFLSKMADLMILNLLTLFLCFPIITAGAALTALHYMSLKIVRGEEGYIVKGYFKSFKDNFLQATLIWILFLVVGALLGCDFYILRMQGSSNLIVLALLMGVSLLVVFTFLLVFPVQAKFANPVLRTIRNALAISILQFPKTILMLLLALLPFALILIFPAAVPIIILFGFSIPAFLSAKLYNKIFMKLEDKVREENGEEPVIDEDEHIFSDEIIVDSDISQNN